MEKVKALIPVVKAEDEGGELVDPQSTLRQECGTSAHVASLYGKFQSCTDRVNSKSQTTETCTEEFFDYLHELDHCVAHSLWSKLK